MSQRADLIKKIKALFAKTVENGCTEDEAIVAAKHAALLMERYDLTFEDVEREIRAQNFKVDGRPFGHTTLSGRVQFPAAWHCMMAIADFFDCKCWYSGADIVFFGTEDDTSLAHDMLAMLRVTIKHETTAYVTRDTSRDHVRSVRASFEHGITDRISERLYGLKRKRTEADQKAHETLATEQAAGGFHAPVVVAKQMVLREKFAELGIQLSSRGGSRSTGSRSAYMAGQAAGERVSLSGAPRGLVR
jgi:uncharacterized protein DUF2786